MSPTRSAPSVPAILATARTLLESQPADAVTMDAVATGSGFSRQALYRHFGSRAGLLTALLESIDETEGAHEAVADVLSASSGRESVERLVAWWSAYVPRFAGVARGVLVSPFP
jgi:AcrR family transcriptional regulator